MPYSCSELEYYEAYWRGVGNYHETQAASANATADDYHSQWEQQNCGQSFAQEGGEKAVEADKENLQEDMEKDFAEHMKKAEEKFRKAYFKKLGVKSP